MIINNIRYIKMNDYEYLEYEEYEKEDFLRWYYGKFNIDEEIEKEFEKDEERRWYYGYEKDY